ncbi:MAG: DNRLRE domain-containing protein [Chloroflexi bacterium]|nr:DNRLRE domain-containing protein [Chloroflexota bacterium]
MVRKTLSVLCPVLIVFSMAGVLTGTVLSSREPFPSRALDGVQSVLLRQGEAGYAGCVDTRISEENPNANFGDGELVLGMKGRVGTLIRFDVSSIPANALIQEATLGLWVSNYGQRTTPIVCAAYQLLRTWEEMQATWYKATNTDNWGTPGCNHTTTDRSATPLDHETIFERDQWYTWEIKAAVQGWVQAPASNKGVLIQQTNKEVGGEYDIRESEYVGLSVRPYLLVKYTLGTPTPTLPVTPPPLPCVGTPEPGALLAILQEGGPCSGVEDTGLDFDNREAHLDADWFMRVGYRRHYSGLIKYDLSCIPEGSRIICAALGMYAERWSGGPLDVGVYYVNRPNAIDEATWTWATSAVAWQMGGCDGPEDRLQTPEWVVTVGGIYRWYWWNLTRVVDGWVGGALPNHGVALQGIAPWDEDTVWFAASDDGTVGNRPMLVVLYVPPAVPGPTRTATPTRTPTVTPTVTRTPTLEAGSRVTVTLQNGLGAYAGCADTRITSESPAMNFEAAELRAGARQRISSLIRFDLSSIPSTATVHTATLHLYGYQREGTNAFDLGLYAVRRAWAEDQATWNEASSGVNWATAGCNQIPGDRVGVPAAQVAVTVPAWYNWSVPNEVQQMVSGASANYGWLLRQVAEVTGVLSMYSSEHGDISYRPKLVVSYSVP